ncbi:succinate dehydrogenase cytochrome b subunit [Myxococcota bacterium]|nr:succinate dehydrogenase cytochrome b subunit [Myxococcota bacterium]MBU1430111.1 succinate dehydrogenase cytochrome b subunit [Myxococcota bacterium]MBU1896831.1 succinate dehydrogenase cytochrome b subunit [Myxococcota bacterium]
MSKRNLAFYDTTIGKKAVMAVSGLILIGFIIGHMLGNLQIFMGADKLNAYAHLLHSMQGPLWGARLVIIAALIAHFWSAISLTLRNRAARPVQYQRKADLATTYAAKTMIFGGIILALFIVFHLAHLTLGEIGEFDPANVYANVVAGFQVQWIAGFYILAQAALALHLYHGAWSFLQTLGANHAKYNHLRKAFSIALALAVAVGNISIPVAVLSGFLK